MSEWTSLSCKEDTKARIAELKEDGETQDDVLNKALDALQREDSRVKNDAKQLVNTLSREDIEEIADREIKAINKNTELLKDMDVVSNNQRVLTRIDDLETELKTHFERELGR